MQVRLETSRYMEQFSGKYSANHVIGLKQLSGMDCAANQEGVTG